MLPRKIFQIWDYLGHFACFFKFVSFSYYFYIRKYKIKKIIRKSTDAFCDLDLIPTYLVKNCIGELIHPISVIVNTSLAPGILLDHFKTAHITPLLKKAFFM